MNIASITTRVEAPRNPSFRWFQFLVVPMLINVSSLVLFPSCLAARLQVRCFVEALCGASLAYVCQRHTMVGGASPCAYRNCCLCDSRRNRRVVFIKALEA